MDILDSIFESDLLFILGVATFLILLATRRGYRSKTIEALSGERPKIKWLPKYAVRADLSRFNKTEDFDRDAFENALESLDFKPIKKSGHGTAVYSRGLAIGNFAIKTAPVTIAFDDPLSEAEGFQIQYGQLTLFDAGDLWQLAVEVREELENA